MYGMLLPSGLRADTPDTAPPETSVPTSSTRATCWLLILAAERASRRKRSAPSEFRANSGYRNFTATGCSSSTCQARTTTPIAPAPITCSIRYFPASSSPGRMGGWRGSTESCSVGYPGEVTKALVVAVREVSSMTGDQPTTDDNRPTNLTFLPPRRQAAQSGTGLIIFSH